MEWFDCANSDEMVVLAATVAITLAKDLSNNEINALGNFLEMVGQNLEYISSQRTLRQNSCPCEKAKGVTETDSRNLV